MLKFILANVGVNVDDSKKKGKRLFLLHSKINMIEIKH